jgi:hypothetical protein
MSRATPATRWIEDHRAEVRLFLSAVDSVEERSWERPWAAGKWTPAQIAEHVVLYYEVGVRVLAGTHRFRQRVGRVQGWLLRLVLLPHILFHRTLPLRVRAPKEVVPTGSLTRGELRSRLERLTDEFERATIAAEAFRASSLVHPYFGPIRPLRFLRLSAVHLAHHRRQIEKAVAPRP